MVDLQGEKKTPPSFPLSSSLCPKREITTSWVSILPPPFHKWKLHPHPHPHPHLSCWKRRRRRYANFSSVQPRSHSSLWTYSPPLLLSVNFSLTSLKKTRRKRRRRRRVQLKNKFSLRVKFLSLSLSVCILVVPCHFCFAACATVVRLKFCLGRGCQSRLEHVSKVGQVGEEKCCFKFPYFLLLCSLLSAFESSPPPQFDPESFLPPPCWSNPNEQRRKEGKRGEGKGGIFVHFREIRLRPTSTEGGRRSSQQSPPPPLSLPPPPSPPLPFSIFPSLGFN